MSSVRPVVPGKTRPCPHCKAIILESASVCPGCHHHLRFDNEAQQRQLAAESALRVEGRIDHPAGAEPREYCVVVSVRNDRNEEVAREVVNVGALQPREGRTFTLSVEVLPPKAPSAQKAQPLQPDKSRQAQALPTATNRTGRLL
jgi:uncharacterized protein involved in type VI secretion and phage assembly